MFEKKLVDLINNGNKILDFGCGACKLWENNIEKFNDSFIKCIDLNKDILKYAKYNLRDYNNIDISNDNIFDLNINDYDISIIY